MACRACGASGHYSTYRKSSQRINEAIDCEYTLDMMKSWKTALICARDSGKLGEVGLNNKQVNAFLGTILSGINLEYNICFLKDSLDKIEPFIVKILALEVC